MKSHALFLIGALLVSSAWAQEPATNAPVLTPRSFDLSSDYIKKIVRDTAATQSALVQPAEEKPAKREPVATVRFIPPVEPPPVTRAAPRPVAAPQSNGFLSAVIDILIDEALDLDDDLEAQAQSDPRLRCQARGGLNNTTQNSETCPGR